MEKNKKIILIVVPIIILIGIFSVSLPSQQSISFESENELEKKLIKNIDEIQLLDLPIIGDSDAPVTIIAFNDYQCASCKTWHDEEFSTIVENLIETKKANIVFLDSIGVGQDSVLISEATFCANDQGKYLQYQELLFNSQQKIDSWAKSEQLKKFAVDLDLNFESFEKCLDSSKYENNVLSNMDYSESLGVDKIPIFKIINSDGREHILKGGMASDVFENIINQFQ